MSVNTGCYWIKSVKGEWYCTVNRARGDALSERCERCEKENRPVNGVKMRKIGYCDHGHQRADCVRQFEIDTGFIRPVCPVCGRRYAVIDIDWQYRKQAEIN